MAGQPVDGEYGCRYWPIKAPSAYLVSEGRGLHSRVTATTCSVPFLRFVSFSIGKPKPARRIRPSRELEVGVDATGNEEFVGTSSTVQGVPDVHHNARESRKGIGGSGDGKGRAVVGSKENARRVRSEWRGAYSPGFALARASSRSRWSSSFLVCWGRANVLCL